MNQFIVFIFIALSLLLFVLFLLNKNNKRHHISNQRINVIKIPYSLEVENKIKNVINLSNFTIVYDIVVEHIGRDVNFYISTEKKFFAQFIKLIKQEGILDFNSATDDYLIFHHTGVYEVLMGELNKDNLLKIKVNDINLSQINEIGEGLVIRMVFFSNKLTKIIMFFSAPTKFQLREIINDIILSFKEAKCHIPPNKAKIINEFGNLFYFF